MRPRIHSVLYINGYGVPQDLKDDSYQRYLSQVVFQIMDLGSFDGPPTILILAGGATNPQRDTTEAAYIHQWLVTHHGPILHRFSFRLLEESRDLETNLRCLRRVCQELELPAVTLYCEWSQQEWFRFLTYRLIPNAVVEPIVFVGGHDPHVRARLWEMMKLPWRVICWYWRLYWVSPHTLEPVRS